MGKHNPEKRAWRGRSYKKGGELVIDLKDAPDGEYVYEVTPAPVECQSYRGCGNPPTEESHSCPFASEINGDHSEDHCNCCEDCQYQCAMDI